MSIQRFLKHISLERQFERRQDAWKPNMHVQEDVPLFLIDGVLMQEYTPPSATNEHTMVCFSPQAWQEVIHENESDCS